MSVTDISLSEKFEVEPIPEQPTEVAPVKTDDENDIDRARQVFNSLITHGETAVTEILNVADITESPRAYEVAATMIKTVADVTKDLIAMQKHRAEKKDSPTNVTQTNVFVGSTSELLKMLQKTAAEEAEFEVVEETDEHE